ncbi:AAA family ATPase [Palleronia sp. LCG004]|uniref:AAA family ATPase n=1 Tax=Palleronia sp. LCG004 TaxID=3079304 RepID=UPI00294286FF|nr:AAA family ATPase [Palleronia sp. LCG004]WOI55215.1 AAA family ATPase [Palleronia sp. LCG004]
MKLRAISLVNVRKFTDPVMVDGLSDGLNILSEPNEAGKSTLFDALRALFFVAHRSRSKEILGLKPHADGAPEVTVTIETEDGLFDITKRWLSRPEVRVVQGGRLIAQADAAEDWIAARLSGGEGGPAGLIWARQGATHLQGAGGKESEQALDARRDLLSSVTGEVEAMTGGRRMDAAVARCRDELAALATKTGAPRAQGPWKAARDRVALLSELAADLDGTARLLHDALDQRRRQRAALAELEDPERREERRARRAQAEAAHAEAERHAQALETATAAVETARLTLQAAEARRDALDAARTDLAEAESAARDTARAADCAGEAARAARTRLDTAREAADASERRVTEAEARHARAQRRQAAREGAAQREDLSRRIAEAETLRRRAEEADARAAAGPDDAALRNLDTLAADAARARDARAAGLAHLTLRYSRDDAPRLAIDGKPLEDGARVTLDTATDIAIAGIGTLSFAPGAGGADPAPLRRAEAALAHALDALGTDDIAAARAMGEDRRMAERAAGEARATLAGLAPQGIEALRAAHARIPPPDPDESDDIPDPTETDAALVAAREARIAARGPLSAAQDALAQAGNDAARAEAARDAAGDRHARARASLERLAPETDPEAPLAAARDAHAKASERREAAAALAPDLEASAATLARARAVETNAEERIATLRPELATLDERIRRASGDAVEERLAETRDMLHAAEQDLARIEREVAILMRLRAALEDVQETARERYFAPVAAELRPLLNLLWPQAELSWAPETLLPDALIRDGHREPVEILSGGTQEQIAILVRLAFARMLARAGRHAPVILDDALVFTDDDRIERMFDALHRQSGSAQIIVLTCRQRAFRDLGARELSLAPLKRADPSD